MSELGKFLQGGGFIVMSFIGTYLAFRRRQSGRARALKELPELARRFGLESRAAEPGRIGAISGKYEGYDVFVDADERPRVVVYLASAPAVALRTFEHEKRVPAGMTSMLTDNAAVDRFFKDRYASPALAAALHDDAATLERLLEPFTGRWYRNVSHVSITSERLECALDFGRPSHIPKDALETLLPGAVALARFVEQAENTGTD